MPRSAASRGDAELIAHAARHGVVVTARQLERWRARGLLPPNIRRGLGRGRGSISEPLAGTGELVVWLAANARPGRRPGGLALLAFAAGLGVPEATVRAAFADAVSRVALPVEAGLPPGTSAEAVADAAVAAGLRVTMVPARVRRIDHDPGQWGVNWAAPEFAALDPGRSEPRPASSDWVFNRVRLVLSGGGGIDMGTVGALARTLAPAGGLAPLAGQVEYRWPISRGIEPAGLPEDEDLLALLGNCDLRVQLRDLAMAAPATELLDAFQVAASVPGWADGLCAAVEREIAARRAGSATREWVMGALGLPRLLLVTALRDQNAGPAATAATALALLFVRNMIRTVRQLLPAGNAGVLNSPFVAPTLLVGFLDR